MTRLRIVNLGLPKTGTTTLSRALRRANFSVADWRIRPHQTKDSSLHNQHVGSLLYKDYFEGGDPLARLDAFDAINEMSVVRFDRNLWPQMDWGLLSAIQDHHPGTKFLLSHRDAAATASSMKRWLNLGDKRLPKLNVPGLPRRFGKSEGELERWIDGHYKFCRQVFAGADNFLEFDIADAEAPAKIGAFLGRPLQWWGHVNKNKPGAVKVAAEVE